MNNNYYKSPKPSWLMRQFWKACGADAFLLERSTYTDQIKYFCLGGIVVATGVMAALAGGYAFYTIFEPKGSALDTEIHFPTVFLSAVFGIIWGLIIYNIDRFIVTSTGKGDGTEAITGQEFKSAIPRIIMGMIIALTISKPIEIRMFKSEIDQKLFQKQQDIKEKDKQEAEKSYQVDINKLQVKKDSLNNVTNFLEQRYYRLEEIATQELDGTGGSGNANPGPIYQAKKADAKNAQTNWFEVKKTNDKQIVLLEKDIDDLEKEKIEKVKYAAEKADKLDGLLERLKLAHKIAGFWISLFITLLFMVIELTPIFFKMMLIKGPYDYMDENVKDLARAEAGIEVIYNFYKSADELKNDSTTLSENNIHKNKLLDGYDVSKVINHAAELKAKERLLILKAQEELNEEIVRIWKEKKLHDINENPDKYVDEQQ